MANAKNSNQPTRPRKGTKAELVLRIREFIKDIKAVEVKTSLLRTTDEEIVKEFENNTFSREYVKNAGIRAEIRKASWDIIMDSYSNLENDSNELIKALENGKKTTIAIGEETLSTFQEELKTTQDDVDRLAKEQEKSYKKKSGFKVIRVTEQKGETTVGQSYFVKDKVVKIAATVIVCAGILIAAKSCSKSVNNTELNTSPSEPKPGTTQTANTSPVQNPMSEVLQDEVSTPDDDLGLEDIKAHLQAQLDASDKKAEEIVDLYKDNIEVVFPDPTLSLYMNKLNVVKNMLRFSNGYLLLNHGEEDYIEARYGIGGGLQSLYLNDLNYFFNNVLGNDKNANFKPNFVRMLGVHDISDIDAQTYIGEIDELRIDFSNKEVDIHTNATNTTHYLFGLIKYDENKNNALTDLNAQGQYLTGFAGADLTAYLTAMYGIDYVVGYEIQNGKKVPVTAAEMEKRFEHAMSLGADRLSIVQADMLAFTNSIEIGLTLEECLKMINDETFRYIFCNPNTGIDMTLLLENK